MDEDEDQEAFQEKLKEIILKAQNRKNSGEDPQELFIELVEEMEHASEVTCSVLDLPPEECEVRENKKMLAKVLEVDYDVPKGWLKEKLNKLFIIAEKQKDDETSNETQFDILRREIHKLFERAHRAVDRLWDVDVVERKKKKLATILGIDYLGELDWMRKKLQKIFSEAEEKKHLEPKEKKETFKNLSERVGYEIEHSYFYMHMVGAVGEIEKNLEKLREILEYEEENS